MTEELLVTARLNAHVDPGLAIWNWQVAVYLFLGGMTAGIILFSALATLLGKDKEMPFAAHGLSLWAPVILSVGMTTLFLDLEYKLHVFRFYTTLQPASPMSWGSWILAVIYLLCVLQIASTLRAGYPRIADMLQRLPGFTSFLGIAERYRRPIAAWCIPFGVALGIYTGILLSAFSARPFWNTTILGPLFLISGLSAAAALAMIVSPERSERHWFARADLGLIAVEILLVALLLVGLATGGGAQLDALALVTGGDFTISFWGWFVFLGLVMPLILELWELAGGRPVYLIAPVLVLVGGFMLRQVTLEVGQASTWSSYETQFDPALLGRLTTEQTLE